MSINAARTVAGHVDAIQAERENGVPMPPATAAWLDGLGAKMRARFAELRLIDARADASVTMEQALDRYIKSRVDVKRSTIQTMKRARKHLLVCFGEDRPVASLTVDDGHEWGRWLRDEQGLVENTARKTAGIARQMLGDLTDAFDGLRVTLQANRARQRMISRANIDAVLDALTTEIDRRAAQVERRGRVVERFTGSRYRSRGVCGRSSGLP